MGHAPSVTVLQEAPRNAKDAYPRYDAWNGAWWTSSADADRKPNLSQTGIASVLDEDLQTLPQLYARAAKVRGAEVALAVERPVPPLGKRGDAPPALPYDQWMKWTYAEYFAEIETVAKAYIALGFQENDTVNVWGFNSPEWMISACASQCAGGKVAGLYPTDTADAAAYKVVHGGGAVVVLEDRAKLARLAQGLQARGDATKLLAVVGWNFVPEPKPGEKVELGGACGAVPVMSWQALKDLGEVESASEMQRRCKALSPGRCAALIYTSGTTGMPKAVMLSHDNVMFEGRAMLQLMGHVGVGQGEWERVLSYLPLSHIAGMMVDIIGPWVITEHCGHATAFFTRPYDLRAGALKDRLQVARPTVFLGVPLVWEKIADKMRALGLKNKGLKKKIGTIAKRKGLQGARHCQLGGDGVLPLGYRTAGKLMSKIKMVLGLDKCKFQITGAAPIRVETLEYFASLQMNILELYGMSECSGMCTLSLPSAHVWGSVGFEMPSVAVRAFAVDPDDLNKKTEVPLAPDLSTTDEKYMGELCFRGRNVMMGYLANPDLGEAHVAEVEQQNRTTIDNEGWLHSGDKGMISVQGMAKITGRYKELIIGTGGENIAPVPIEDAVKGACDGISEVIMIGDKRKYNVCMVTLKAIGANGEAPGTDVLDAGAARLSSADTIGEAIQDKGVIDAVQKAIEIANANTKCCINNAFKIQKFTILTTNFSEETGELTPTKKVKRKVVETKYAELIDRMYATDGVYIQCTGVEGPRLVGLLGVKKYIKGMGVDEESLSPPSSPMSPRGGKSTPLKRWAKDERHLSRLFRRKLNTPLNSYTGPSADWSDSDSDVETKSPPQTSEGRRLSETRAGSIYSYLDPHDPNTFMAQLPRFSVFFFGLLMIPPVIVGLLGGLLIPFGSQDATMQTGIAQSAFAWYAYMFNISPRYGGWDFTIFPKVFKLNFKVYTIGFIVCTAIEANFGASRTYKEGLGAPAIFFIRISMILVFSAVFGKKVGQVICGDDQFYQTLLKKLMVIMSICMFSIAIYMVADSSWFTCYRVLDILRGPIYMCVRKVCFIVHGYVTTHHPCRAFRDFVIIQYHGLMAVAGCKAVFACPDYTSLFFFALTDVLAYLLRVWAYAQIYPDGKKFPRLHRYAKNCRSVVVFGKPKPHSLVRIDEYRGIDLITETLFPSYLYVSFLAFYPIMQYGFADHPLYSYFFASEHIVEFGVIMIALEFVQDHLAMHVVKARTKQTYASIFVGLRAQGMPYVYFLLQTMLPMPYFVAWLGFTTLNSTC